MAERNTRTRLLRRAAKANIILSDSQADNLSSFLDLLVRWNRKINLTALAGSDEAIDRLLLEPLIAARHLPNEPGKLIDVGSGGGSPGIPLALATDYEVTMVESKARKAAFLREAIRMLGLTRARVETTRFQLLLGSPAHRSAYRALSVRAVRLESQTLTELSGFLRSGGVGLVFRGPSGPDRVADAPPLEWTSTHPLLSNLGSRLTIFRLNS